MSTTPARPQGRLEVEIHKQVTGGGDGAPVLSLNVSFATNAGLTVLFGASGAGKTTILDCIAGLQTPDSGYIATGGTPHFDSTQRINVSARTRHVGYLFQTLALFPHMTGRENIEYGLAALPAGQRTQRIEELADSFEITHVLDRRPSRMSGGERQRVALARALVTQPRLLLLDEPLTALDAVTKAKIIDDLRRWLAAHAVPVLYVTHDREEVFALGDRVIVLDNGRVAADGTPHEVMRRPQVESVAQLAGFENILDCHVVASHPDQGTMTCIVDGTEIGLEAPLTRLASGAGVSVGVLAGDIMVSIGKPVGLSARNVIPGRIISLRRQDVLIIAEVDCGAKLIVHLTPGAQRALMLDAGKQVWLVIKTYSCHVLSR